MWLILPCGFYSVVVADPSSGTDYLKESPQKQGKGQKGKAKKQVCLHCGSADIDKGATGLDRCNEDRLVVRARVASDLDNLRTNYLPTLSETVLDHFGIRDYPARAWVDKTALAAAMPQIIMDIDYTNFKSEVQRTQGAAREANYHRVWSVLADLEATEPVKGRCGPYQSGDQVDPSDYSLVPHSGEGRQEGRVAIRNLRRAARKDLEDLLKGVFDEDEADGGFTPA